MSLGSLAKAMPNLPIDVGSSWSVHRAAILFCSTTENIQFGTQGKIIYECGLSDLWSLWSHVKVSLTSFCSALQSERVPSKRIHQEQRREKDLPGKGLGVCLHTETHTHVHVHVCVCVCERPWTWTVVCFPLRSHSVHWYCALAPLWLWRGLALALFHYFPLAPGRDESPD